MIDFDVAIELIRRNGGFKPNKIIHHITELIPLKVIDRYKQGFRITVLGYGLGTTKIMTHHMLLISALYLLKMVNMILTCQLI